MDERVLAERLITYDTSHARGAARGGRVRQGLARGARHRGRRPRVRRPAGRARRRRARADGPTVVFHGHLDVVPAHDGQFDAARRGRPPDRPRRLRHEGRARGDDVRGPRRGRAGPRPRALRVRARRGVRGRRQPLDRRARARGPARRLRDHRRADRPAHRRPGQGRARGPRRACRGTARTARRRGWATTRSSRPTTPSAGSRRCPSAASPRTSSTAPSINLARIERRRRVQQGARPLHDGRRHPLPAQPGPGRDPRPDPRDPRPRDRQDVHARAGHRLAPQPVRAARCATPSAARSRARR